MSGTDAGYRAAREGAAVLAREDRRVLRVHGRDPVRMLAGLVTNDLGSVPEGGGAYGVLLTPKGKLVAETRLVRRADDVLVEVATETVDAAQAHFAKYVPPLFARGEAADLAVVGVYGPRARALLEDALALAVPEDMPDDDAVSADTAHGALVALRTPYAGVPGFDLLVPAPAAAAVLEALRSAGAEPLDPGALDVLRIEAGSPRWGAELTPDVIPLEAGLRERAIAETKGCYTGQEVIIRILHRGRVNWHLRGFLLGDAEPTPGATLARPGEEKTVARITSACRSPALGQVIGLGYGRRELDPPARLELRGAADEGARPEAVLVGLPFARPPDA